MIVRLGEATKPHLLLLSTTALHSTRELLASGASWVSPINGRQAILPNARASKQERKAVTQPTVL
ncbi:MAG: hypothetical protein KME29_37140 [Calothrix sp. FI2-JRJ7]|jgi:hypothetical protein|nr:hypothetical protein [Calothrix sp. FI2-JRJ7]